MADGEVYWGYSLWLVGQLLYFGKMYSDSIMVYEFLVLDIWKIESNEETEFIEDNILVIFPCEHGSFNKIILIFF